jgi:hypothetical protein
MSRAPLKSPPTMLVASDSYTTNCPDWLSEIRFVSALGGNDAPIDTLFVTAICARAQLVSAKSETTRQCLIFVFILVLPFQKNLVNRPSDVIDS